MSKLTLKLPERWRSSRVTCYATLDRTCTMSLTGGPRELLGHPTELHVEMSSSPPAPGPDPTNPRVRAAELRNRMLDGIDRHTWHEGNAVADMDEAHELAEMAAAAESLDAIAGGECEDDEEETERSPLVEQMLHWGTKGGRVVYESPDHPKGSALDFDLAALKRFGRAPARATLLAAALLRYANEVEPHWNVLAQRMRQSVKDAG